MLDVKWPRPGSLASAHHPEIPAKSALLCSSEPSAETQIQAKEPDPQQQWEVKHSGCRVKKTLRKDLSKLPREKTGTQRSNSEGRMGPQPFV